MSDQLIRAISKDGHIKATAVSTRALTERARQIHKALPVATAALDNVSANAPDESTKMKLASLTAPYICLDGLNEKGVSIAVLTLDSDPVHQNTGKPAIATTLAIRLVLDRAASTEEAVELLRGYARWLLTTSSSYRA